MCSLGMILAGGFFKKKSPLGSISRLSKDPWWRQSTAPERLMTDLTVYARDHSFRGRCI